jgi:MoxR-like ATPase
MELHRQPAATQALDTASTLMRRMVQHIETVIIGRRSVVDAAVVTMAAGGHLLIEDVPGTGKTILARALARTMGCTFQRIQLTPDLLPADITGSSVYNPNTATFEFRPGPITAQVVLADELNRATPRTQSALLEAMEERQITVDGITHALPQPFMVIATQNAVEYEGTFPLPEAQLDRFAMQIAMGYPRREDELTVLRNQRQQHPITQLTPLTTAEDVRALQATIPMVYVDPIIDEFVVSIGRSTRRHDDIVLGVSTRALLSLIRTAQATALLAGRDYVMPDDVIAIAGDVLSHRMMLAGQARLRGMGARQVLADIIAGIPLPNQRISRRPSTS